MAKLSDADKEIVARMFRDVIYGNKSTDKNWDSAKTFYLTDLANFSKFLEAGGYEIVKIKK